jgi:hypothetical protein
MSRLFLWRNRLKLLNIFEKCQFSYPKKRLFNAANV